MKRYLISPHSASKASPPLLSEVLWIILCAFSWTSTPGKLFFKQALLTILGPVANMSMLIGAHFSNIKGLVVVFVGQCEALVCLGFVEIISFL